MSREMKRAFCEMCHSRCRVLVHSENGRLLKIEEDRTFPGVDKIFPPTRACQRLRSTKESLYHPDRIKYPLKRAGGRGEARWETISWEQAFAEIAEKLQGIKDRYGAEAVASTRGTGRTSQHHFMTRFMNLFGSPNANAGQATICFGPFMVTSAAMFGWPMQARTTLGGAKGGPGGVVGSKCIFILGFDPSQSYLRVWKTVLDARKAGLKIIVVDPRRTQTAEQADLFLQLRPGTDTALLMSMIHVIIEEELYDKDFVEKWCFGFDRLAERVRDYPPEKMADITWVSAQDIRAAARMYATNRPAWNINGMGTEHLQDVAEALQCRNILAAITGNIDVEGGQFLPGPAANFVREPELDLWEALPPEQKRKQLGADRFKLLSFPGYDLINESVEKVWGGKYACSLAMPHAPTLYRAMLSGEPYPVKGLITNASNPLLTQANVKLVYKALKNLDLYVVIDWWLTPSAELADYVLPAASWIERPYLYSAAGTGNVIVAGEKALPSTIAGEYDRRSDYEILRGLAVRLGQEKFWPWQNLEEVFDYQLKPLGMTHREFMAQGGFVFPPNQYKKYEKIGFGTPTGKVELYSTIFEKLGYDPLPKYAEPAESPISSPELAREYPYLLITGGRFQSMYHSEHRQVASIRKKHPEPLVQVHPETAAKLAIKDGDWVWVESPRGRVRMKCKYFTGIDPRVVHCEHGWWFPELPGEEPWLHGVWESNVNVLTADDPDRCNKHIGGWPLKTALCKLYTCKTY